MLEEYLSSLPHGTLRLFFDDYIPTKGLYSPRQTVSRILQEHFQPEALIARYQALPDLEKDLLLGFFLDPRAISAPDIRRFAPGRKAEVVERALHALQTAFFIVARGSVPVSFQIFPEVAADLQNVILEERISAWSRRKKPPMFSPFIAVWNDLATLLIFAAKGRLGLTQKGFLAKRPLDDLNAALQTKEDFGKVLAENVFRIEQLPERFRLLYTYALDRELLEPAEEALRLTGRGLGWLQWNTRDRMDDFLSFAVEKWVYPAEDSKHLFALLARLSDWVDAGWLLSAHRECDHESAVPPPRSRSKRRFEQFPFFLRILCYAGGLWPGWDRTGKAYLTCTADGRAFFTGQPFPGPVFDARITADFGVLIPAEADPWRRFSWSRFCNPIRFDQVYHLRITRVSVHEALENDVSAEEIRDLVAGPQVAANIVQTLDGWISEFGRLSFSNPFILLAKDQGLMEELKKIPTVAQYLRQEIPGYGFVVDRADYRPAFETLQQAGLFPRSFRENANLRQAAPLTPCSAAENLEKCYKEIAVPQGDLEAPSLERHGRAFRPGGSYGSPPQEHALAETVRILKHAALARQSVVLDYAGDEHVPARMGMDIVPLRLNEKNHKTEMSAVDGKTGRTLVLQINRIRRVGKGREK